MATGLSAYDNFWCQDYDNFLPQEEPVSLDLGGYQEMF